MIYFKDRAKQLGCKNVDELTDKQIWVYIIKNQPVHNPESGYDPEIDVC